jgi:hypothetical protein
MALPFAGDVVLVVFLFGDLFLVRLFVDLLRGPFQSPFGSPLPDVSALASALTPAGVWLGCKMALNMTSLIA